MIFKILGVGFCIIFDVLGVFVSSFLLGRLGSDFGSHFCSPIGAKIDQKSIRKPTRNFDASWDRFLIDLGSILGWFWGGWWCHGGGFGFFGGFDGATAGHRWGTGGG